MVAPLRISRDANCGQTWSSSGTRPASAASTSLRVSAAPIVTRPSLVETSRSSAQPVDRDDVRAAARRAG